MKTTKLTPLNSSKVSQKSTPKKKKQRGLEEFLLKRFKFRYNIPRNRVECCKVGGTDYQQVHPKTLWRYVAKFYGDTGKAYLLDTIGAEDMAIPYDPLKTWMERLKWCGKVDYINELCSYIVLANPSEAEHKRLYVSLKKWFVGAIKTLYDPKYAHKQALIFQGDSGIGKTPFCENLLPPRLAADFIKWAVGLNMDTKDSQIALTTSFIIILDEIDDFFRDQRNRLKYKSVMTQKHINVRLPFGETEVSRQRIASFVGTCNETAFLNDHTGTQRFTVFSVEKFINKRYGTDKFVEDFDISKVWGQAYTLFKAGYCPEYTHGELVNNETANEMYKYNSPEFETIEEWLEPAKEGEEGAVLMTATDICAYLNSKQEAVKFFNIPLGKALQRHKFVQKVKWVNGRTIRGYYVRKLHPDIEVDTSVITKESLNKFMASGH